MSLYQQTTEAEKYLAAVGSLAPRTLQLNVQLYKANRAIALGLPMVGPDPSARGGFRQLEQVKLGLSAKLAALGTNVGPMLMASGVHKAFIEGQVATAVESLGGFATISPNGEWAWVLEDVTRDGAGAITGYSLPGLPFVYTSQSQQGQQQSWSVAIDVAQDGSGTATFTPLSGQSSGDPL